MKPQAISLPVLVPALALVPTRPASGNQVHGWLDFSLERKLRAQGVEATFVEEWGPHVRAFVTNSDGTLNMRLFNPVTLLPVVPFLG
jgi:hypothetical protein